LTSDDVTIVDPGLMPISQRKEALLIYFDETDIHWCPDTGKGYQIVGTQEQIDSPGQDQVKYLMGGIVYPTGEGLYQIYHRKRTMEVESYLASLVQTFSDKFLFLIWDNAKTHTTEMLQPFFQHYKESICPVFLPTYSPRLNLIERLWRQMRADMTRNHFAESIKETCEALVHWLENLPFARFMSLMGLDAAAAIS
jgi:transposase